MDFGLLNICALTAILVLALVEAQVKPDNKAIAEGGTTTLSCEYSGGSKFSWFKYIDGTMEKITKDGNVLSDNPALSVTGNHGNDEYNLQISDASIANSDGGHYECRFKDGNTKYTYKAEVMIMDSPLDCIPEFADSSGSPRALDAIESSDTMTLYCTLGMSGNWAPSITCVEDGYTLETNTNYTSVNLASRIFEYSVPNSMSSASVTCEAEFSSIDFPADSGTVFYATNVPTYTSSAEVDEVTIQQLSEEENQMFSAEMPWWVIFLLVIFIVAAAVGLIVGIVCSCKSSN